MLLLFTDSGFFKLFCREDCLLPTLHIYQLKKLINYLPWQYVRQSNCFYYVFSSFTPILLLLVTLKYNGVGICIIELMGGIVIISVDLRSLHFYYKYTKL